VPGNIFFIAYTFFSHTQVSASGFLDVEVSRFFALGFSNMKRKTVYDYFAKKCRIEVSPDDSDINSVSATIPASAATSVTRDNIDIDFEIETDLVDVSDSEGEDFEDWSVKRVAGNVAENSNVLENKTLSTMVVPQGPSDIASNVKNGPFQPELKTFPSTKFGQGKDCRWRSFKQEWFATFPWLEYSTEKNAAFCFPCRFFQNASTAGSVNTNTFTSIGFSNWKNAMAQDKG
jgi:hypothetical protein